MKACIIQARLGSSRLPGKVLEKINGKEMLLHVVERVRKSSVGKVIIATTTEQKDDALADFLISEGIEYYRGSESDVLDRYYKAAKKFGAKTIVRVTSDCPMIDPGVIDKVLEMMPGHDYVSNVLDRTYPRGLDCEAFTFQVLEQMWKNCRLPQEREHVTWHIVNNRSRYNVACVRNNTDYSKYRLTVDEPDDLKLMRAMFELLPEDFRLMDILELLKNKPELSLINAHVEQKKV